MGISANEIVRMADSTFKKYGTRDPYELIDAMNITILRRKFKSLQGAYKIILNNRYIFLRDNMPAELEQALLFHEIGHDILHRKPLAIDGFIESNIFDYHSQPLEYEANIFAAQLSLPDEPVSDYEKKGFSIAQIADALNSNSTFVALKMSILKLKGNANLSYSLKREQLTHSLKRADYKPIPVTDNISLTDFLI